MKNTESTRSQNSMRGFSFLEVLISLLILSIGLLGYSQWLCIALQQNSAIYLRSRAEVKMVEISEYLQTLCLAKLNNDIVRQWQQEVSMQLPLGKGEIHQNGQEFQIIIRWGQHEMMMTHIHV